MASEIGVYDYDEKEVVSKGRLGPGEMLAVDLVNGVSARQRRYSRHI